MYFAVNQEDASLFVLNADVDDFNLDMTVSPFDIGKIKIFRPNVITRRIFAQSGVFTIHPILNNDSDLEDFSDVWKKKITEIKLCVDDIRKHLTLFQINAETVFPDLDGYCRNLKYRFTKH
jgi:hypothetical protein